MESRSIFTVEELMGKRSKILASIFVSAVFLNASPASAQGVPAYNSTIYSDPSHTNQIGQIIWVGCDRWDNPQYQLYGSQPGYGVDEYAGYCFHGEMQY